jgi:hypothetical protein
VLSTITGKSVDELPSSLLPDDREVTITAISTDFLGSNSVPATFRILKKSLPAPQVLFRAGTVSSLPDSHSLKTCVHMLPAVGLHGVLAMASASRHAAHAVHHPARTYKHNIKGYVHACITKPYDIINNNLSCAGHLPAC